MTELGQNRTGSDLAQVQGNGDFKRRVDVRGIQVEVVRVGLTCKVGELSKGLSVLACLVGTW